jgi:hypothetical protein
MIDTIDQREKIFNRWIDTIGGQHDQKYRSIASVSIHRSIADYAHLCLQVFQRLLTALWQIHKRESEGIGNPLIDSSESITTL